MKKQLLFAALAIATLFSACSKEEELSQNNGNTPVNFVIGGVGARTTTNDTFVASFKADDEVGIFSEGLKDTQITNGQYKVTSSNNIYSLQPVATTDFYFDNETAATFYAYYPYAASATNSAVTLTVKTDQSVTDAADNFNCNDLLVATQTVAAGAATADGVTLNFDHVMSFVELTFGDNLSAIGVSEVAMTIASSTITYNFTSTEPTKYAVSGNETSIKMCNKENNKFWAIVPPQTIESGKTLFTITAANGSTYTYTVGTDATEEFVSNAVRKIKLDVASTEEPETATVFKIASISINGWGTIPTEEEDVKDVEEVKLNVTLEIPSTITTVSYANMTDANPWSISGVSVESMVEDEQNVIKLTSGTSSNWYGNVLFCYAGSSNQIIVGQKYKISFDAKANEGSVALHAFAHKKTKDGNSTIIYAQDDENSTQNSLYANSISTENYTTYSFIINTSENYLVTNVSNSATKYQGTVEDTNLVVSFRPAYASEGNSGVYYIKNIKIEQQ